MNATIERVLRADNLWPDDRFKRDNRELVALSVAVTPDQPVVITARAVGDAGGPKLQLAVSAGELLRMVP